SLPILEHFLGDFGLFYSLYPAATYQIHTLSLHDALPIYTEASFTKRMLNCQLGSAYFGCRAIHVGGYLEDSNRRIGGVWILKSATIGARVSYIIDGPFTHTADDKVVDVLFKVTDRHVAKIRIVPLQS